MILEMSMYASKLYGVDWVDVPYEGRHEVKYDVRDTFSPSDGFEEVRTKWAACNIAY